MALIFRRVLVVFNVSGLEFHQVKLLWLYCQWWVVPNSPDLNPLDYQVWEKGWVLLQAAAEAKKQFPSLQMHLADFNCPAGESRQHCERLPQATAGLCASQRWIFWTYNR